jgi:hypothetical protein
VATGLGYRLLSEQSGRDPSTLTAWSKSDPEGTWQDQRQRYADELRTETDKKTIEKTSDQLSDQLSELATEHFKAHKSVRNLAQIYLNYMTQQCQRHEHPEAMEEFVKQLNPLTINFWSLVLDRSIKGERVATGMQYEDVTAAYKYLTALGYEISDPSTEPDETTAKASPAMQTAD